MNEIEFWSSAVKFWSNVDVGEPDECWEWQRCRHYSGYGNAWHENKHWQAHRLAWTFVNGEIPAKLCVCHHCDNKPCCNPEHLFLGTIADNNADTVAKGRNKPPRGESHWKSKLTEAQVIEIRDYYAADDISQCELAAEYRVSQAQIWRIVRRKQWRHI